MPLREWGLGLELLAECYLKYKEWCIVERGRVYGIPSGYRRKGEFFPIGVKWQPFEADLLAVKQGFKELILVQCAENVTLSKAKEILERLQDMGHYLHAVFRLADSDVHLQYMVCYTKVANNAKQYLQKEGAILLSSDEMVKGIQSIIQDLAKVGRKGFYQEPIVWLIRNISKYKLKPLSKPVDNV